MQTQEPNFRLGALSIVVRSLAFFILFIHCQNLWAQGFIENRGQWDGNFRYKAEIPGGALFITPNSLVFHLVDRGPLQRFHDRQPGATAPTTLHHHSFELSFIGANASPSFSSYNPYHHHVNYYTGNDPSRWAEGITPVHTVRLENLYDGIDLLVMLTDGTLKYEFHLQPGADFRDIRLRATGLDSLYINRNGALVIANSVADVSELAPTVWQERGKKQLTRAAEFVLSGSVISYRIDQFDPSLPCVIDPTLNFSTYCGSLADNWGYTATPDKLGFLYAGSISFGEDFPTTAGAYDQTFNGGNIDVCITKYDTTGTDLIYSTYLGGTGNEFPHSLVVNDDRRLYVLGTTGSTDFPTTSNAYDDDFDGGPEVEFEDFGFTMPDGSDLYVCQFSTLAGSLLGSTYLGGTGQDGVNLSTLRYNYADEVRGEILLNNNEDVVIVSSTSSSNFPVTSGAFQTIKGAGQDGIVALLSANLSTLQWATFLGGNGSDAVYGVDVADDNSLYVCGGTSSSFLPVTTGAFDLAYAGGRCDGYIAHISANGDDLLQCTFYGSNSYDQFYLIQLDSRGYPHVFGQTEHTGSYFIENAQFNDVGGGQVVASFEPDLSDREWSSAWGNTPGRPNLSPTAFLVDQCNSLYMAGWGGQVNNATNGNTNNSSDVGGLPTTADALQSNADFGGSDFYLCAISSDANNLIYGTFFGGQTSAEHVDGGTSRFDRSGKIYHCVCAGCGGFNDFPTLPDPGAWSNTNLSAINNCNSAVFKIDFNLPVIEADFDMPDFACAPITVGFDNNSISYTNTSYTWAISNGAVLQGANPSYQFTLPGTYTVRLTVNDPNSCNLMDTITKTITIKTDTAFSLPTINACVGDEVTLGPSASNYAGSNFTLLWSPAQTLSSATVLNPKAIAPNTTTYTLIVDYGGCNETITQTVEVDRFDIDAGPDTIVCSTFPPFQMVGTSFGVASSHLWSQNPEFAPILVSDSILPISQLSNPLNYFYFKGIKDNGCTATDTVLITVSDYDIALTPDTGVCKNEEFTLRAVSENPANTFHYFWTTEPYQNGDATLTDTALNFYTTALATSATYHLFARSKVVSGCSARDSVTVNVSLLDPATVSATAEKDTFYYGETITLSATPSTGFALLWQPGTYLSDSTTATTDARPKEAMTYTLIVTDPENELCTVTDTVSLLPYEILCGEPEVFLPEAFTPDGNGINDVLMLEGRNLKTVDLHLYDRWGSEVFATTDKNIGWDGQWKGAPAEAAVFVYYFEATCIDGQQMFRKGNVTLIR